MGQPFIGEIRMVGFSFAPANWAFCNGQLLSISEYEALFVLIGTTYGGDGQQTFALPNLQSRIAVHTGGTNNYVQGQLGGVENVTLIANQIPAHSHSLLAQATAGTVTSPLGALWAESALNQFSTATPSSDEAMATSLTPAGGNQPHNNLAPYLTINFVISLFGIFPSQN
jgi:microcystin-dependent protein